MMCFGRILQAFWGGDVWGWWYKCVKGRDFNFWLELGCDLFIVSAWRLEVYEDSLLVDRDWWFKYLIESSGRYLPYARIEGSGSII